MSEVQAALAAQHRRCTALLDQSQAAAHAGDWELFAGRFAALRAALLEHFAYEEELLAACARECGVPAEALCAQHREMRQLLETLTAVSPRHDPQGCRAEFGVLASLFREHEAREAAALYPVLERPAGKPGRDAA